MTEEAAHLRSIAFIKRGNLDLLLADKRRRRFLRDVRLVKGFAEICG